MSWTRFARDFHDTGATRSATSGDCRDSLPNCDASQEETGNPEIQGPLLDLIALDGALEELAARDSRSAALVKLRFFAGLTMPQAAEALGVLLAAVENDRTPAGGSQEEPSPTLFTWPFRGSLFVHLRFSSAVGPQRVYIGLSAVLALTRPYTNRK